ncbi:isoprenyl transferase [bacterium]|nr:isoprenyl transferase [bacterium]
MIILSDQLNNSLEQLRETVATGIIPVHVAVIMDGNGRWAKKRFMPRVAGHRAGRQSVRRIVTASKKAGISYLTLYTFSKENWKRPEAEVKALFMFLEEFLDSEVSELNSQNVRLTATGDLDSIPEHAKKALYSAIEQLADNDGLVLNLALVYGGRAELVHATRQILGRVVSGEIAVDDIDEELISENMYSADIPDPDLVIRTSGEYRLSNFLIWQAAYSEIHITDVLWPDFSEQDLLLAMIDYQSRDRRYGGLGNNDSNLKKEIGLKDVLSLNYWKNKLGGSK